MNDMFINMGISVLLELLKKRIPKDGTSKKEWKKALLKVFRAIGEAYKDDPEFQELTKA
ncbi:MAG TPA: hypothetical protein VF692_01495 [Pyrinomonadaceae bacterium]|jgi:hypothetical protein